jgi:CDP-diglyceride synthetase
MTPSEQTSSTDPLIFCKPLWAQGLRHERLGVAERVRRSFTMTLPGSKSRAFWALLLFVAVQIADGAQTYVGILRFGPAIEANPILSFCAAMFGASAALVVAKTVAIIGGATLHVFSQHFILAALTVACVFGAIVPWAMVLSW